MVNNGCSGKEADAPDPQWEFKDLRCGPGFSGKAARDASDRLADLSYETTKITALWNGAIPSFGADPTDPLQIRSIRINPPS
jgi:hypothetical protein